MVSYTGTYGALVGLMALAVIAACGLWATRLTSFTASWKPWYIAFAIITTITTLLGLTYQSLGLAVTADEDRFNHGSDYNEQLANAYMFVNLAYGLFLNVSEVLLFAAIMVAGATAANSSSRKLSQVITYLVSGLLIAIASVMFALECNYNAWFIVGRWDDDYIYYGPPSDLERQALVSTQLDFAFSSIMLAAAVVAIGQSVVASNKAHANKTSAGRLVLTAVLLLITTATQLGILASLVDPSTGEATFYGRGPSAASTIAVAILAILLVVWPLVASMATISSVGKYSSDLGGPGKEPYSQESADAARFGNAPRENVVV
ncbi:hypothetical protein VHEMI07155 [[Torrubiella] hemipterigena]|uniref:Uncharacterized protein n=1 Tax=[Torrubiella] hemipterigena TaxID=1531966 RepID=A0A0A1TKU2_9HYPO|nr:hypothetical protein VHEMI07155 [[Torrubiella] hemipterigena]